MKRRYVTNIQQYCSKYRVKGAVVKPSMNAVEQFLFRKNMVFRNGSNPAIKTPEQNYKPELLSRWCRSLYYTELSRYETTWLLSCYICTVFQESWAVNPCLLVVKRKWWVLAQALWSTCSCSCFQYKQLFVFVFSGQIHKICLIMTMD